MSGGEVDSLADIQGRNRWINFNEGERPIPGVIVNFNMKKLRTTGHFFAMDPGGAFGNNEADSH